MGEVQQTSPVLLIIAASSRYFEALEWSGWHAEQAHGRVALASDAFDFTETDYYAETMGPDLKKQFFAFEGLIDPAALADIKRATNSLEAEYAALSRHPQ